MLKFLLETVHRPSPNILPSDSVHLLTKGKNVLIVILSELQFTNEHFLC